MLHILAHAREEHGGAVESAAHYFGTPINALILWIALVTAVHAIAKYILKLKLGQELLLVALMHFVLGVFFYEQLPNMGAVVISVGFALTLALVITGLNTPLNTKEK